MRKALLALAFFAAALARAETLKLCAEALSGEQSLSLQEVLRSSSAHQIVANFPKTKAAVDAIELIHIEGVYPPYVYGEKLLERAAATIRPSDSVLVLGSGTGYDASVLAHLFPQLQIAAVDINQRAVINTQLNAEFHRHSERVSSWQSDLFDAIPERYNTILFTAPRAVEKPEADPDSRLSNANFFDLYGNILNRFLAEVPDHLKPNGKVFVMTDSETRFPDRYLVTKEFSDWWAAGKPHEGHYAIFRLELK